MKQYVVCDSKGTIIRVGYCTDAVFEKQAQQDELVIEGTADALIDKIVNGQVVRKTYEEIRSTLIPIREQSRINELLAQIEIASG